MIVTLGGAFLSFCVFAAIGMVYAWFAWRERAVWMSIFTAAIVFTNFNHVGKPDWLQVLLMVDLPALAGTATGLYLPAAVKRWWAGRKVHDGLDDRDVIDGPPDAKY